MHDLSDLAGLPLYLEGSTLYYGPEQRRLTAERVRSVDTLAGLWHDPKACGEEEVYSTYLSVWRPEHEGIFHRLQVEHGYVLMPASIHGGEYGKQYGHYHPPAEGTGVSYPELYAVLHGAGLFLLQKSIPPYNKVSDVVVVEARTGESFLVPPNYGHATINAGMESLVFEGFFFRGLKASYGPYEERIGAAYYALAGPDRSVRWVANQRYGHLPVLRHVRASDVSAAQGLAPGSCYRQVVECPDRFGFLSRPGEFRAEWQL